MIAPGRSDPCQSTADSDVLALQGDRLGRLLRAIHGRSRFYTRKLDEAGVDVSHFRYPDDYERLPFTTKAELVADQETHAPWGTVFSEPLERYSRYSQTSSTTGRPLRWLDTPESWQSLVDCWKVVLHTAGVTAADRIMFAFSFGPFAGFWLGFEAGCQLGAQCIPGGGLTSEARLRLIESLQATVVCCTPTYALRLAEVAEQRGMALADGPVRVLIVAGEPGGNIPATRARIQRSWGARVIDHHGLTEVGSISVECLPSPGTLHVIESEYICEVVDPVTGRRVPDDVPGELVATNLRRTASPAIRYRTGDIVVRTPGRCACGLPWARLRQGIVGRLDDMVSVRGVNVYPSAIEAVVRRFPEIGEFRTVVSSHGSMRALSVEIELCVPTDEAPLSKALSRELRDALNLSVAVSVVPPATLPRFEMKSRRFVVAE